MLGGNGGFMWFNARVPITVVAEFNVELLRSLVKLVVIG